MRAVLLVATLALAGCQVILGIDDPKPADDDIGDDDVPIDADPTAIDGASIDAVPIDGPPAQCTLLDPNSCGAGMACDFNAGNSTIECRDESGAAPMSACSMPQECGALATCYHGVCRTYCSVDADCTAPQDHCHDLQHPSGQTMCDSRCDWTSTADGGCGDGFFCRFAAIGDGTGNEMSAECALGPGGTTPIGGTCASQDACVPGSACVNAGQGFQCFQLCDTSTTTCPGSQLCAPLGTSAPLTVHGAEVGVCANPS
jgi:hypothetical protein